MKKLTSLFLVAVLFTLPVSGFAQALIPVMPQGAVSEPIVPQGLGITDPALPLVFEANRGRTDASVRFLARANNYNLFLTYSETILVLKNPDSKSGGPKVIRISFKGANTQPAMRGQDVKGVDNYAKVELKQVYAGIDVVYYGNANRVEHGFIVAPGANPGFIRMAFNGAKEISLDLQGNLILDSGSGQVVFDAPVLYQKAGDWKKPVYGRYVLVDRTQVRFEVGAYDHNKELVIN